MHTPESIELREPEQISLLKKDPFMPMVLIKGLMLSLIRPSVDTPKDVYFTKYSSSHNSIKLDLNRVAKFKKVCGFPQNTNTVPMLYLQSLFIGQFGKYIISPFFPFIPLGLIHTKQSILKTRDINQNEILDTKFTLDTINIDQKGLEITFLLEIKSGRELVWKGITTTLCKSKKYEKMKGGQTSEALPYFTIIDAPKNIGREYAKVSGDYNPHHLSAYFARLFGFKRAIAHGMWSLARSVAEMEKHFSNNELFSINALFKRPLLLPGKAALAAKKDKDSIIFELRDNVTSIPHITGFAQTQ